MNKNVYQKKGRQAKRNSENSLFLENAKIKLREKVNKDLCEKKGERKTKQKEFLIML